MGPTLDMMWKWTRGGHIISCDEVDPFFLMWQFHVGHTWMPCGISMLMWPNMIWWTTNGNKFSSESQFKISFMPWEIFR